MSRSELSLLGSSSSSSSSSSFIHSKWTYHIFLSFRGADTRDNFTGHLYEALIGKGIHTFMDDRELQTGNEISAGLVKAITDSKISIVVFSENYASSRWCLDELVKILECKKRSKEQVVVVPIFYKVHPSDVRNQTGSFEDAFAKHEIKYKDNKVNGWRAALKEAADLSGHHYLNGSEAQFINKIVKQISPKTLVGPYLDVAKYPVGMESSVSSMMELLDIDNETDVRMVGIWGSGGIGKTTIAKAVYNSIAHRFEGICFLGDVGEKAMVAGGLVQLQETLLFDILGDTNLKFTQVDRGVSILKEKLRRRKSLIILDDVDSLKQLDNLAREVNWFGGGSRIIITTRDMHLLTAHRVSSIYEVQKLDDRESLALFSWHAFGTNEPPHDYREEEDHTKLIEPAVQFAQGLPLVLINLGSNLCGSSKEEWLYALESYKRIPNKEIQKILRVSFDALEENAKEVFLDIACFFKDKPRNYVVQMLESCDLDPVYNIATLQQKALVTIDSDAKILMHDLIQEMGKEIVRQESPHEPGKRSRLWFHNDVMQVLTTNTGTKKVRGIMLKFPHRESICLSVKCFKEMKNLRFFINVKAYVFGDVDHLSNELRLLAWPEYPLQSLPSEFLPRKLIMLHMTFSRLKHLGNGFESVQVMNLVGCKLLRKFPDVSKMPCIRMLYLDLCSELVEVHESVGRLKKLVTLSLIHCSALELFPRKINLTSLESIDLSCCRKLKYFPEVEGKMDSLRAIYLAQSNIKELPESIGLLSGLEELHMDNCCELTTLPDTIYKLQRLKYLSLDMCYKLVACRPEDDHHNSKLSHSAADCSYAFTNLSEVQMGGVSASFVSQLFDSHMTPDCLSKISTLDLSVSDFSRIPVCIRNFVNLVKLVLNGCPWLEELSELPASVIWVDVSDCGVLKKFADLSAFFCRAKWINLSNCVKLTQDLDYQRTVKNKIKMNQESYASFEFGAVVSGSEVPKWFSHSRSPEYWLGLPPAHFLRALVPVCELSIEVPVNSTWDSTGLAFCVIFRYTRDRERQKTVTGWKLHLKAEIHINKVHVGDHELKCCPSYILSEESDNIWLQYVPLPVNLKAAVDIESRSRVDSGLHYICRIKFHCVFATEGASFFFKKCGVHVQESCNGVVTAVDDSSKFEYLHCWPAWPFELL